MRPWWLGLQLVKGLDESAFGVEARADAADAQVLSQFEQALDRAGPEDPTHGGVHGGAHDDSPAAATSADGARGACSVLAPGGT